MLEEEVLSYLFINKTQHIKQKLTNTNIIKQMRIFYPGASRDFEI